MLPSDHSLRAFPRAIVLAPLACLLACGDSTPVPSNDDDTTASSDTTSDSTITETTTADSSSGDAPSGTWTFSADSLSGAWEHTCARDDAGELFCWGPPLPGGSFSASAATPTSLGPDRWRAHSIGQRHGCAVRDDGTLWCWGSNCAGQLGDGTRETSATPIQVGDATSWIDVAAGGGHSCAIDDTGALTCWGGLDYGQNQGCDEMPSLSPTLVEGTWSDVSANWYSIHALRSDGTLWRMIDAPWGEAPPFQPITQVGSATWRVMASGISEVCGIRTNGTLACAWDDAAEETQVGTDDDWGDAIAVSYHACATKADGSSWCWGRNDFGQLGIGTLDAPETPTRVGDELGWTALSAGYRHSCGVRDGALWCWGGNGGGELGAGDLPQRTVPTRVGESSSWSAPSLGSALSCANDDATWKCWGRNRFGQLGSAGGEVHSNPIALDGSWTALRASDSSICAIDDAFGWWCWGNTDPEPTQLRAGITFAADGLSDRCALETDRTPWCFGDAFNNSPSTHLFEPTWIRIASGSISHFCGIASTGALLCWGENGRGQLGIGSAGANEPTPVEVDGGGTWRSVAVVGDSSTAHSCGIRDDGPSGGRLFCWGSGALLGDGDDVNVVSPRQAGTKSDWMTLSLGPSRGCAIDSTGELWCWGWNGDGGLGIGSTDPDFHEPERVGPEESWSEIAVASHTCATTTEGTLWCWGYGAGGELGNGLIGSLEPLPVAMPPM